MITIQEIKAKLDSLGTLGPIKAGSLPASPDAAGAIYEYGGGTPEKRFGIVGIGYEKPSIQVVFRGNPNDYLGPRLKAEIAWRYLASIQPGALGAGVTTEYYYVDPQQSPFPLNSPDEQNNRTKIAFNLHIMKDPSA